MEQILSDILGKLVSLTPVVWSYRKASKQARLSEDCTSLQWEVNSFSLVTINLNTRKHAYLSLSHRENINPTERPSLSAVLKRPTPEDTVTSSFGKFISEIKPQHLSPVVLHRSKRMVLDSIGVGLIGSTTEVFQLVLQHCQVTHK